MIIGRAKLLNHAMLKKKIFGRIIHKTKKMSCLVVIWGKLNLRLNKVGKCMSGNMSNKFLGDKK
ncbi:hypothetical protein ADP71_40650 [Vitreoscilla sp. C1]|nr:hypothetical protein ADP71_40650 [Vitreoscilla sp. C1]